jgi:hypothetical protein
MNDASNGQKVDTARFPLQGTGNRDKIRGTSGFRWTLYY